MRPLLLRITACLIPILAASAASGTVIVEHRPPDTPGIRIESTDIEMEIQEGAARLRILQILRNDTAGTLEASFVLPIPKDARAHSAALRIGEEWVEAEVLDASQARQSYEDIVRRMIDPALIEHLDDGLLRTRVFPVPPHGERELELSLSITLPMEFDAWTLRVPLPALCGDGRVRMHGEVHSRNELLLPYSPTHRLEASLDADARRASFSLPEETARPTQLSLVLPFAPKRFGVFAASTKPAGDDGFVLLRIAPGSQLREGERLPKDLIFVLDTSGSMRGEKLRQARAAVQDCLRSLDGNDRFAVLSYAAHVQSLTEGLTTATHANVEHVIEQFDRLRADGGTNIGGALDEALRVADGFEAGRAGYVLFLTDGLPTVGEQNVPSLLAKLRGRGDALPRMFSFGVGHDVNTQLLDGIANISRATARYVLPGEDLETSIGRLTAQIAEPLWTELELTVDGAGLYDLMPGELGDLFAGQSITVLARYRTPGERRLELRGLRGRHSQRFATEIELHDGYGDASYIPQLWASKKIALLERELRDHPERGELRDQIVEVATRYGILTSYTSLLMREKDAVMAQALRDEDFGAVRRRIAVLSPQETQALNEAPPSVGSAAVESAAKMQRVYATDTVEEAVTRQSGVLPRGTQQIGNRYFEQKTEGEWVDRLAEGAEPRLTIARHSDAYFELLRMRPDLRALVGLGDVRIALGDSVLAIAAEGARELSREDRAWLRTARL